MITLRNKIGQMLVMGFNGFELNDSSPVAQWLTEDGLGGVILFDKDVSTGLYEKNLQSQSQIKHLTHQLKAYSSRIAPEDENIPLFIAIDYEGGAVDRLSKIEGCMPTLTPAQLALLDEEDFVEEVSQMAATLNSLGFNLNFAPLVDLNLTSDKGIIGSRGRCFSSDPEKVTHFAKLFVEVFNNYGIACCYKHFPGHGSATGDTHEGFVDVTNTFSSLELLPYSNLLKDMSTPAMVMTAHVINKNLDKQGLPATLSYDILTNLLRETMKYDGVIISDDLQMRAVADHYSLHDMLRLTINAGADMMIFANQLGTITAPEIINAVEQLVQNGDIDPKRIDDAFRRVIRLKKQMAILELVE